MLRQDGKRNDLQCASVCGSKVNLGRATFVVCLQEPRCAQTPRVSGLKAGKVKLRSGGAQIISNIFGIGQKLGRHNGANRVATTILGAGIARTVAEKPG